MNKKILFVILFFSTGLFLQAQQAVTTGGGSISGTSGSVTFTIGLVDYLHPSGISGFTTQGVQQPYEILMLSVAENAKGISLECAAYPNPVADLLTLKLDISLFDCLSYQLLDLNGKLLNSGEILQNETVISMENLPAGTYILSLTGSQNELKSYKIIKK